MDDEILTGIETADLRICALRLRQLAEHEVKSHQCTDAERLLIAIAKRLEWFHEGAMAGVDLLTGTRPN